jgi:hypothetical protein
VNDSLRGGVFTITNTVAGTNLGTLIASTAIPGWSWRREFTGPTIVTWFGTKGAPADDSAVIANAISSVEAARPGGVLYFPEGTYRAQGLHVHRCYLKGEGMTLGAWAPSTMLELVPNATSDLLYFDEASAADSQAGSGISDITLNGHRSANLVNPVPISTSNNRLSFSVGPGRLPSTLVDDGSWMHFGFCFFYTASNRYVGYGLVQSADPVSGQVTLLSGYDRYATPNPGDSLPPGWQVCFTPNRTTYQPPRWGGGFAQTFNDPVAAGRSGIVISSANVVLQNVCVWDFHTGIAGYTAAAVHMVNVWCENNGFAGIANADRWSVDSKFERLFVQGPYYEYPGEAAESPTLSNYTWRHTAYGVYGFWNSSSYADLSIAACVVDVGDTGGEGTDIGYLLLDVPIKSGISSLGSFSNGQSLQIGTLDARAWGDWGTTNGNRQLPVNVGTYAVWDQVAGGRYYSIDKFSVHSFDYTATNWFTTVFNYWASSSNSPISIGELVEFTGAQTWFIGGGAPPIVNWIDPKATITAKAPDGWHESPYGVSYSAGGNDALTFRSDGSVAANSLFVGTLSFTNLNFGLATLNATNLAFTNLAGSTFSVLNGSVGYLTSSNLLASGANISNLNATTLTSGAAAIGALNTSTFNSPTGAITGLNSQWFTAGFGTLTNATIGYATIAAGSAGNFTITNLTAPVANISTLGALTLSAPTGAISKLNSYNFTAGSATITNAVLGYSTIGGGTVGTLTVSNLTAGPSSLGALSASSINSGTGTISGLTTYSLYAGGANITNASVNSLSALGGTIGNLTVTNLYAGNASLGAISASGLNSPTGLITSFNSANLGAGSASITNLSVQSLIAGAATVSNLISGNASLGALSASSINSGTGTISGLTTYGLVAGTAAITSAIVNQGTLLSGTAGTLTVTNLVAANATLGSISAAGLNSPTGVISSFNTYTFGGGTGTITNLSSSILSAASATIQNLNATSVIASNGQIGTFNASTINSPTGYITGFKTVNLDAFTGTADTMQITNLYSPNAAFDLGSFNNFYASRATIDSVTTTNIVSPMAQITDLRVSRASIARSLTAGVSVVTPTLVTSGSNAPAVSVGPGGLLLTSTNQYNTVLFPTPNGGFQSWDNNTATRLFVISADTKGTQIGLGGPNYNPRQLTISGDSGIGTNTTGADLFFCSVAGTGNSASGGNIHFYTPDPTISGTNLQQFSEKFTVTRDGSAWFRPVSAVPPAAPGKIYSDGAQLYVSDTNLLWLSVVRSRLGSGALGFTFPAIPAGGQGIATASVPFAVVGENVVVNPRGPLPVGIVLAYSRVSAPGTVEVTLQNTSAIAASLGTVSFDVKVIK